MHSNILRSVLATSILCLVVDGCERAVRPPLLEDAVAEFFLDEDRDGEADVWRLICNPADMISANLAARLRKGGHILQQWEATIDDGEYAVNMQYPLREADPVEIGMVDEDWNANVYEDIDRDGSLDVWSVRDTAGQTTYSKRILIGLTWVEVDLAAGGDTTHGFWLEEQPSELVTFNSEQGVWRRTGRTRTVEYETRSAEPQGTE